MYVPLINSTLVLLNRTGRDCCVSCLALSDLSYRFLKISNGISSLLPSLTLLPALFYFISVSTLHVPLGQQAGVMEMEDGVAMGTKRRMGF